MSRKVLIFIYLAGACLFGAAAPFVGANWTWAAFSALYMLALGAILLLVKLHLRQRTVRAVPLRLVPEPDHDDEQDTDVPGGVLLDLDDILRTGRN